MIHSFLIACKSIFMFSIACAPSAFSFSPCSFWPFSRNAVALGTLLILSASLAGATSIESLNGDELLDRAELVFEGEVLRVETKRLSPKLIVTQVEFEVLEVINGSYDAPQLTLKFVGGKVADMTMNVAEMIYPRLGEQGVYFVESVNKTLVNPLVGWSQGHFTYQRDQNAIKRVCTAHRNPIMSMDFEALAVDERAVDHASHAEHSVNIKGAQESGFSHGFSRGVRLARSARDIDDALTSQQFKEQIKNRVFQRIERAGANIEN